MGVGLTPSFRVVINEKFYGKRIKIQAINHQIFEW